ncbi:MAG TPA: TetR/AcrR family transcriptional regulator [Mycobacterium sp.]|jgi:AcrR family transcriptional regulator|uniref:TetR/AcrR family transcriptional regulator n=1 Tax=Mycobacterium sp. TaxID=1785 RepID=UPI002F3F5557
MAQPAKPLRADAARNRARVLETAYDTFAADGLAVPIDEIARRAGVGAGTVYRHFPTKEDLFSAVVESRLRRIIDDGRALLDEPGPGEALFAFLRSMVLDWGATDQGLVDALAGLGINVESVAPEAEQAFRGLIGELLVAAQRAGSVRLDVDVPEIKALMVGCQAMHGYDKGRAERVTHVVIDGLRPAR